jgi:hypothetical protein
MALSVKIKDIEGSGQFENRLAATFYLSHFFDANSNKSGCFLNVDLLTNFIAYREFSIAALQTS